MRLCPSALRHVFLPLPFDIVHCRLDNRSSIPASFRGLIVSAYHVAELCCRRFEQPRVACTLQHLVADGHAASVAKPIPLRTSST